MELRSLLHGLSLFQGGVTTVLTVLTFATAGQDEVKGSSTTLWVGQAVKQL